MIKIFSGKKHNIIIISQRIKELRARIENDSN